MTANPVVAGMMKKEPTMNEMRKRALAAACQYLEAMKVEAFLAKDYRGRVAYAQGLICRAAKVENGSFNRIGRVRLRSLTAAFNKMKRDIEGVIDETIKSITQ